MRPILVLLTLILVSPLVAVATSNGNGDNNPAFNYNLVLDVREKVYEIIVPAGEYTLSVNDIIISVYHDKTIIYSTKYVEVRNDTIAGLRLYGAENESFLAITFTSGLRFVEHFNTTMIHISADQPVTYKLVSRFTRGIPLVFHYAVLFPKITSSNAEFIGVITLNGTGVYVYKALYNNLYYYVAVVEGARANVSLEGRCGTNIFNMSLNIIDYHSDKPLIVLPMSCKPATITIKKYGYHVTWNLSQLEEQSIKQAPTSTPPSFTITAGLNTTKTVTETITETRTVTKTHTVTTRQVNTIQITRQVTITTTITRPDRLMGYIAIGIGAGAIALSLTVFLRGRR